MELAWPTGPPFISAPCIPIPGTTCRAVPKYRGPVNRLLPLNPDRRRISAWQSAGVHLVTPKPSPPKHVKEVF